MMIISSRPTGMGGQKDGKSLDFKSLIDLKTFGKTSGIGEGNWPHCAPWLRAWT